MSIAQDNGFDLPGPNDFGKFIVDHNWQPHVWRTGSPDGDPFHHIYASIAGLQNEYYNNKLNGIGWIDPGGKITPASFGHYLQHQDKAHQIVRNELGFGDDHNWTLAKYAQELKSFVTSLDQWKISSEAYKGLVLNNGQVHTWPMSQYPYHETYMHHNDIYPDQIRSYHDISGGNHWSFPAQSLNPEMVRAAENDKPLVQQALGLNIPEHSWAL